MSEQIFVSYSRVDTDFVLPAVRARASETRKHYFPAEIVVPAAIWLASDRSAGITGCRYVGSRWDASLPEDEAAEKARDPAIFLPPVRDTVLTKPWQIREAESA